MNDLYATTWDMDAVSCVVVSYSKIRFKKRVPSVFATLLGGRYP